MNQSSQDEAAQKALDIMFKLQLTKLGANIIGSLCLVASIVVPVFLSYSSGNWGNLFLLLVYPAAVAICSALRHKGILGEGILLLPLFAAFSRRFLSQPIYLGYFLILWGITIQYYMLFYRIPSLEDNFRRYSSELSSPQQN